MEKNYKYTVAWSTERQEYVGRCSGYPELFTTAKSPRVAFLEIVELAIKKDNPSLLSPADVLDKYNHVLKSLVEEELGYATSDSSITSKQLSIKAIASRIGEDLAHKHDLNKNNTAVFVDLLYKRLSEFYVEKSVTFNVSIAVRLDDVMVCLDDDEINSAPFLEGLSLDKEHIEDNIFFDEKDSKIGAEKKIVYYSCLVEVKDMGKP
jgi:hypothetical protein